MPRFTKKPKRKQNDTQSRTEGPKTNAMEHKHGEEDALVKDSGGADVDMWQEQDHDQIHTGCGKKPKNTRKGFADFVPGDIPWGQFMVQTRFQVPGSIRFGPTLTLCVTASIYDCWDGFIYSGS